MPDVSVALSALPIGVVNVHAVLEHGDLIEEFSDENNYRSVNVINYAPGDFEPDKDVYGADLATLSTKWLETENLSTEIYPGNGDGIVNFPDYAEFVNFRTTIIEQ